LLVHLFLLLFFSSLSLFLRHFLKNLIFTTLPHFNHFILSTLAKLHKALFSLLLVNLLQVLNLLLSLTLWRSHKQPGPIA
jgi:hypothetical protein